MTQPTETVTENESQWDLAIRELKDVSSASLNPWLLLPDVDRQRLRLIGYIPEHDLGCSDLRSSEPGLMKRLQERILTASPVLVTFHVTESKI